MIRFPHPRALPAAAGTSLGASPFRPVPQREIDAFGTLTGDRQWIHHDAGRALGGPFGTTVAHGMLSLSLVVPLLATVFSVDGVSLVVHKGFDQVRFWSPVPAGGSLRLAAELVSAAVRPKGFVEATVGAALELEDGRTACTARLRLLYQEEERWGLPNAS